MIIKTHSETLMRKNLLFFSESKSTHFMGACMKYELAQPPSTPLTSFANFGTHPNLKPHTHFLNFNLKLYR